MVRADATQDGGRPPDATSRSIERSEFADRFQESSRILWLIAIGIVGDRTRVEDVIQEAALIALEKLDQFEPGTNFSAWMGQIVRFVALNYARREHSRVGVSLDPAAMEEAASSDERSAAGAQFRLSEKGALPDYQDQFDDALVRALKTVAEIPRACLLLRTVEGLEYSEISRILGIPEGTAMSHVHRTRHALRERLSRPDVHGPAARNGAP